MIQEIPQQARQQLRPKPKSSGFGVEVNLDFHDKNFFSQCSNISKQGVYVQVNYREIVKRLFPIDSKALVSNLVSSNDQIRYLFLGHPVLCEDLMV